MNNPDPGVESFFAGYEAANGIFDVDRIASCYADVFMFGGPQGVQSVKKEDFLKVLPRRKDFFRSQGLASSTIHSLETSLLDSKYVLVRAIWNLRFTQGPAEPVPIAASYILSKTEDRFCIVFQLDHQDLAKIVQDRRERHEA